MIQNFKITMGKPFDKELHKIDSTIEWALNLELAPLKKKIESYNNEPLVIVGSGGSLSACFYASFLYQKNGGLAKVITPLDFYHSKEIINQCHVLFISASGKNNDILFAFKVAVANEPKSITSICMAKASPLSKLSLQLSIAEVFEYVNPSGKDGFLATNSLVGYFTILSRVLGKNSLTKSVSNYSIFNTQIENFIDKISKDFTLVVLYGGISQSIAIDIESKLVEAALLDVVVTDYRNFAHGRHHWFDKRGNNSAIVSIISPADRPLAIKTVSLLPNNIPVLEINTNDDSSLGALELLVKSFKLIGFIGKKLGIDPGKPGVPEYGSKLYHLNFKNFYYNKVKVESEQVAIERKTYPHKLNDLSEMELGFWAQKCANFKKNINGEKFGSLVLDYDGTLCSGLERFAGPREEVKTQLNRILRGGFIIGIATGRGQSVRKDLQKIIEKKYWSQVIVGYYNGSDIAYLDNDNRPNKNQDPHVSLLRLTNSINLETLKFQSELRPFQLTLEANSKYDWIKLKLLITNKVKSLKLTELEVLESSHSIDIVVRDFCSKINVVKACQEKAREINYSGSTLCIGDKGQWPGNDYELLNTTFSLSVDEVSPDPETCWNFGNLGNNGIPTTVSYLSSVITSINYFKVKI